MDWMLGITAIKAASDGLGAFLTLKSEADRLSAIVTLRTQLNDAALSMSALVAQNTELERAKRNAEDREAELRKKLDDFSDYTLARLPSGALVYSHQGSAERNLPAHHACTYCWDVAKEKSRLQSSPDGTHLHCQACKAVLFIQPSDGWNPVPYPVLDPAVGH